MKRLVKLSTFGLLAFCLAAQAPTPRGEGRGGFGSGFRMMSMGPVSRTPVTGAPYSAVQTTESRQTLADGNQVVRQEQAKVYRDSQGRVRIERTRTGARASTVIAIYDPVAGSSYVLHPDSMTAFSTPLHQHNGAADAGAGPPHERRSSAQNQVQTDDLGTQLVSNLSATGTRTTRTIPAGEIGNVQPIRIVREAWVSVDLKVPVLIKTSDPRFGTTEMQLANIVRAEPDASLFQIPSGYTVTQGPTRTAH